MKVAIVGASGHVGTALLRALREREEIDEILGLARREPDVSAEPYDAARWERVDIAMPVADGAGEEHVVARLAELFEGFDTVVHLAWLIQPNRQRRLLRRANVDGTRRVIEACLRAGVGHLVCASSVGAYSGVDDDVRRDESWRTDGVPTSHYSVDKAAQERLLDDAEQRGLAVARLRPALAFDAIAGAEIMRLFVGALVPPALLRPGRLPILPLPAGLRMQVVHGEDLADAYCRAIVRRATGAFNIATEPVLHADDIAAILGRGRFVSIPPAVLRPLLAAAWRTHAVAADPGWLDMAMSAPLMNTARAGRELAWTPKYDAREALRQVLHAIADGSGTASPPMRPRRQWPQDQLPPGEAPPEGPASAGDRPGAHRLPARLQRDILGLYLSDHLTGATAGVDRAARMAKAYGDTAHGPELARLARQLREERAFLHELIGTLELRRRPYRQVAAWAAEKAGRLKVNGRVTGSPMTPVLELELMRGAVTAKLGCWQVLGTLAFDLGMPRQVFDDLAVQARMQRETLERIHAAVAPEAFRSGEVS